MYSLDWGKSLSSIWMCACHCGGQWIELVIEVPSDPMLTTTEGQRGGEELILYTLTHILLSYFFHNTVCTSSTCHTILHIVWMYHHLACWPGFSHLGEFWCFTRTAMSLSTSLLKHTVIGFGLTGRRCLSHGAFLGDSQGFEETRYPLRELLGWERTGMDSSEL